MPPRPQASPPAATPPSAACCAAAAALAALPAVTALQAQGCRAGSRGRTRPGRTLQIPYGLSSSSSTSSSAGGVSRRAAVQQHSQISPVAAACSAHQSIRKRLPGATSRLPAATVHQQQRHTRCRVASSGISKSMGRPAPVQLPPPACRSLWMTASLALRYSCSMAAADDSTASLRLQQQWQQQQRKSLSAAALKCASSGDAQLAACALAGSALRTRAPARRAPAAASSGCWCCCCQRGRPAPPARWLPRCRHWQTTTRQQQQRLRAAAHVKHACVACAADMRARRAGTAAAGEDVPGARCCKLLRAWTAASSCASCCARPGSICVQRWCGGGTAAQHDAQQGATQPGAAQSLTRTWHCLMAYSSFW